ncbi:MAG TPA: adenylate/guanylate cyclase domain-containing protein [Candidatus Limnocylindrales bacterium]|nr:adenylate/guanylate cyclase domain-containing protein [Candidatus Limnocylindrales bacterium]
MAEERRLVTVLFADVVGSTALGEALDPEDVRALLGRLYAIATEAVERHGGRVEKFIGDAIMAVFGVPVAHDDDPARALSAAMELRDRVKADARLSAQVPIRLGVNGGEVIASREEDARVLVTGDPVNTAARLQSAADPWSILVGERTVRAAQDRFQFGPRVEVEAKGKAVPVAAHELIGVAAGRSRRRATKIVGREADLDQLELVARRAFDEGRPYLVSVVAPAGVGKSRLLEEFLGRLDPKVTVVMAQCLPYGQRLTYWPMRAILLSIVGCPEGATPDEVRAALGRWLRAANEPDPDRTAELLAATIGASEIEGDRLAVFAAWRRFVELAAAEQPLALVIEDLHWSSDSLLDLVDAVLQPRADVPLVMIVLARPELLDRRPGWGGGRRNAVSIALEPLSSKAVEALVADLLDTPSPEIVRAVVARAEGNPFYAGEIVRSLVDRLGADPSAAAIEGAIASLPDNVQATVLARLDALPPVARRVVQLGAVIGRTFEPRAIPAVDPLLSELDATTGVDDLIDRELVRLGIRGEVTFRHILIREVAYNTLPRAERARIHGTAGRWFADEAAARGRVDELAELIAFHLREAVTIGSLTGDPVAPELAALAVEWLRRAAEAAAAGAAAVEAARHLNAAIELAPAELQPEMYERLGQIWGGGGGDAGPIAFEKAWELAREQHKGPEPELRLLGQAMWMRARWIGSLGHLLTDEEAARRYSEIERLMGLETSDVARFHGELALGFRGQDSEGIISPAQLEIADVWAARAVESARKLGQPDLLSAALDCADANALGRDDMTKVLEFVRERHAIEDRVSTPERADAWIVHAWAEVIRGNLREAEQAAERSRAGFGTGQAASFVLGATAWRIVALHALGRWDEAMADVARAERALQESELTTPWYSFNGFIAALAVARARNDSVGADTWKSLMLRLMERGNPGTRTRAMVGYLTGDLDALARGTIHRFQDFSPRLDYVHLAAGLLADRRHAVDPLALAALIDHAESKDLLLISSQARRLRGIVNSDAGDLRIALDGFDRMGARPFTARVRTELGALTDDREMADRGLDELEGLGDVEQAARVAAERRTRAKLA